MKKSLKNIFIFLVFLFLFLPIIVLVIFSFNSSELNIVFESFTLNWYINLFDNRELIEAFSNTIIIAIVSTIISVIIGTLGAIGLHKYDFAFKNVINKLLYIPIVIPEIVLGISLLSIYTLFKLELSIYTILLSHIVFSIPFVVVSVRSAISNNVDVLENASYDLGASNFQTLFYVTLPSILSGVKSGALLSFTLSLDDVIISYFTAGPSSNTLPLKIYSMIKTGITPDVYALSTILLLVVFIVLTISILVQMRSIRRNSI